MCVCTLFQHNRFYFFTLFFYFYSSIHISLHWFRNMCVFLVDLKIFTFLSVCLPYSVKLSLFLFVFMVPFITLFAGVRIQVMVCLESLDPSSHFFFYLTPENFPSSFFIFLILCIFSWVIFKNMTFLFLSYFFPFVFSHFLLILVWENMSLHVHTSFVSYMLFFSFCLFSFFYLSYSGIICLFMFTSFSFIYVYISPR